MIETQSHRTARETLIEMGRLFFSGVRVLPGIRLRLLPLVIGPTGAGKSFLVERVARELGAHYVKLTRGDWLVMGSRAGRPTMYQILDALVSHERVVVHLDELDKFQELRGDWSAAIGSDVWNLLDRKFLVEEYLRNSTFPEGKKPTPLWISLKIQSRLWIVGSGTWQDVFEQSRPRAAVGFQNAQSAASVGLEAIAHSGVISPELLHRFNNDAIFLSYPSKEETAALLKSTGIAKLAEQVGVEITPADIPWERGGMRVLETVATRLAIQCQRRDRPRQVMIPFPDDDLKSQPS